MTVPLALSAIIPALNAAPTLPGTLAALGSVAQCLVVDGGSSDGTPSLAAAAGVQVLTSDRGRGPQIAAGIAAARSNWLLILHADTQLQPGWRDEAALHMARHPDKAAYFRFALASTHPRARRLEAAVAWRCRTLALPYGDQGLLIHRTLLCQVGGVRPLPLMEDVDLIRRLGRTRLLGLQAKALTSAAKWESDGWSARSARNLTCLALWWLGVPPRVIARVYR